MIDAGAIYISDGYAFQILGINNSRTVICVERWGARKPSEHVHMELPLPACAVYVGTEEVLSNG